MFAIKKISDKRLSERVCGSYGLGADGLVYGAWKDGEVLATAVFELKEDCVTLYGADTGRKLDIALIDAMTRAAFSAQMRAKRAQNGCLGEKVPAEVKLALTKLGYQSEGSFALADFLAKKNNPKG